MKRRFTLREVRDAVPGSRSGPPMTVRQVAALVSISYQHYSNVETGRFAASPRLLWRLAMAYQMPYEDLWEAYQETRRIVGEKPPKRQEVSRQRANTAKKKKNPTRN